MLNIIVYSVAAAYSFQGPVLLFVIYRNCLRSNITLLANNSIQHKTPIIQLLAQRRFLLEIVYNPDSIIPTTVNVPPMIAITDVK